MGQLQRLIQNYLWSGNDGSHARAKVSWSTTVKPLDQGGLGIVDPLQQFKSLIAKLVIRGLLPGSEPWKQLLFYELQSLVLDGLLWDITSWLLPQTGKIDFLDLFLMHEKMFLLI